ncbi:MAG: type B DNA-directed DNA polymerase [Halobacteriaceae archaeon]
MSLITVDARGEEVVEWHRDAGATTATSRTVSTYTPSMFVDGSPDTLDRIEAGVADDPRVVDTARAEWRTALGTEPTPLLRLDCARAAEIRGLARHLRSRSPTPGSIRFYDVDLAPGFRYCLDRGLDPTPPADLRTVSIRLPERALAADDLSALRVDGERVATDVDGALDALAEHLETTDPDALVVSHADVIPTVATVAAARDVAVPLGRRPGYERLAGASTYVSYGDVGHSPARYTIPGRALIAEDAAFVWEDGRIGGLRYLTGASRKPLQEVARGSIGTILTAIEVRHARQRGVLAPWNKWTPEAFTDAATFHRADRGGATLSPAVGLHEDVHELDFASLYPSVIREYNVSPETVRCDCHDRRDVPELGYSVCDADGFLPDVLGPLIDDRAAAKAELDDGDLEPSTAARLEGVTAALKWVLVSCFGYQGYRNAKYGRIECHEAINAYARELLLDAKDRLEAGGWTVVHGIVDSLWVTPRSSAPTSLSELATAIGTATDVPLEREAAFDWVCFVPRRDGRAGTLTRYFGRQTDGTYKYRGIACRRRDTPSFIAAAQRDLIATVDAHRDPATVCDRLTGHLAALRRGAIQPSSLVRRTRVSKAAEAYEQETRTVAALRRARDAGLDKGPGQTVRFVVVDDDARGRARVRLPFEATTGEYDTSFYADRLVRATESVTAPLGWDRDRIERYLRDDRNARITAF